MPKVISKIDDGDGYIYTIGARLKTRVKSSKHFSVGDEVVKGPYGYYKPKPAETVTRTRWVLEDEVDDGCEITDIGYYDDGEPNGWVEITYKVDGFGRVIR